MVLRRGFSIVELIIAVGIASLLIVAVTVLIGRFFSISRAQFEQTRTTEIARIQLDRMTDTIRNARTVDCNGNGAADQAGEWWLQEAGADRVVFYSNVDSDAATEKITYEKNGTDLERSVEQDTPAACTFAAATPQVVAHSLYNTPAQPLFEYVDKDGATPKPVVLADVVRLRTLLIVDADGRELETAAIIATDTTPRLGQSLALAATPISPTPQPTATPVPSVTPSPVPTPPITPRDCVRTGATVAGKIVSIGDGGCVYTPATGDSLVWRMPIPPLGGLPNSFDFNWNFANTQCETMMAGGRSDWRLPTVPELTTLTIAANSLGGATRSGSGLSIAHLYLTGNDQKDFIYWTSSIDPTDATRAEAIGIRSGTTYQQSKVYGRGTPWTAFPSRILCVAPLQVPISSLVRYPTLCSTLGPFVRTWCDEDEPTNFGTAF